MSHDNLFNAEPQRREDAKQRNPIWRSGISGERRPFGSQMIAALCRDAATIHRWWSQSCFASLRLCVSALILVGLLATSGLAAPRPLTGKPWVDMDYGPFLTASIEAPQPATNIAFKGIAIRLADAFGGSRNEAVVFDTDLLRYSVGWTGDFVALKGVVFDGEHWAYPQIAGDQVFGNPLIPGWSADGRFTDPRPLPYGPLPREQAHWRGLYLHGDKVVLSYSVADASVLEMPGLESRGEVTAFSRSIEVGKSEHDLELQLAYAPDKSTRLISLASLRGTTAPTAADSLLLLASPQADAGTRQRASAGLSNALAARFEFEQDAGNETRDAVAGSTIRLRRHQWDQGVAGHGLKFSGRGSGEFAATNLVDFDRSDLTIATWIKTASDGTILAEAAPNGPWVHDGKAFFIRGGKLAFDVGWVGAVGSQRSVVGNQWIHVAMTWSHRDGRVALFINGVKDGSGTLKPRQPVPGHITRIGFASDNFPATPYFNGALDDLRIYHRQLNAGELAALAGNRGQPGALAFGVVGAPIGATWLTASNGHARLRIPAEATPCRFKVLLAGIDESALPRFAELVAQAAPVGDLAALTHGGPPRWPQKLTTPGKLGSDAGPFAIDAITAPEQNPWHSWLRFGGFDFFSDPTRAAICTWNGDVWLVSGIDDKLDHLSWQRIATGLFQPLGLKIVNDEIYVLGRDQITRLRDLNGDGETDFYENFSNDALVSEHFHEFAMDLQTGPDGSFYYMKGARHAREAVHPQNGTLIKVSKDGLSTEVLAGGFRAPNGLLVTSAGDCLTSDQEGHWNPANKLIRVKPGSFNGNNWGWLPDGKRNSFEPPICWIHPSVDRSPSSVALVESDRWGLPRGSLLAPSYGMGRIFLLMHETTGGIEQGGVTPLPLDFSTGIMRGRFNPRDGQFYTCGLFGWAGNKTQPGGFYRVRYTGKPLHLPDGVRVATNGVVLHFTDPLDAASAGDTGNYSVQVWNYRWTENYGSPDFKRNGEKGRDKLGVEVALLSADRRSVFLKLTDLTPAMQMHIQVNLKAADGAPIATFIHNTVHRLGTQRGEEMIGAGSFAMTGSTAATPKKLMRESPGLFRTVSGVPEPGYGESDTRIARLVALHVPAGQTPTPFFRPGPFRAFWRGFLKLDVSETVRFEAIGTGSATVRVNGRDVFMAEDLTKATLGPEVALSGGLNEIDVTYTSPQTGGSTLRLYWSGKSFAREPVPPGVFVHDGSLQLNSDRQDANRRLGREVFTSRLCIRCHEPATPFGPEAMPELAAEAPALDNAGGQFNAAWVTRWLENPRAQVPEALMPAVLYGTPAEISKQATDLASFLATIRTNTGAAPAPASDEAGIRRGEDLFTKIGCVACHILPGDIRLENDTRRSLAHVKAKWQPAALVEFLQQPEKRHTWTRMPNFRLTPDEAAAVAGFVLSRADATPASNPPIGDLANGKRLARDLGCANCHTIPGVEKRHDYLTLEKLVTSAPPRGCLSRQDNDWRKRAPDFGFMDHESEWRGILAAASWNFAQIGRDTPIEFAERQFKSLRCFACHAREDAADFWFAVEQKSAATKPAAKNPFDDDAPAAEATIHKQRPPLTWLGEKLRPEWAEQFIAGKIPYKPRPKLDARMPGFPAYARGLAHGFAMEHGFAPVSPTRAPVNPDLAKAGEALARKGALACMDCHSVGTQEALAGADTVTINFAWIPERLNKHYFDRYLLDPQRVLPGTMMPKFCDDSGKTGTTAWFEGDARQQFEAVWHFMRTVTAPAKQ